MKCPDISPEIQTYRSFANKTPRRLFSAISSVKRPEINMWVKFGDFSTWYLYEEYWDIIAIQVKTVFVDRGNQESLWQHPSRVLLEKEAAEEEGMCK